MKKIVSRARETPTFAGVSAEDKLGSQTKCQECLGNQDVCLALEIACDQTGSRNVRILFKTHKSLSKTPVLGHKIKKTQHFLIVFAACGGGCGSGCSPGSPGSLGSGLWLACGMAGPGPGSMTAVPLLKHSFPSTRDALFRKKSFLVYAKHLLLLGGRLRTNSEAKQNVKNA